MLAVCELMRRAVFGRSFLTAFHLSASPWSQWKQCARTDASYHFSSLRTVWFSIEPFTVGRIIYVWLVRCYRPFQSRNTEFQNHSIGWFQPSWSHSFATKLTVFGLAVIAYKVIRNPERFSVCGLRNGCDKFGRASYLTVCPARYITL